MDENHRKICMELRSKSSEDAASWVLQEYPISNDNWGEALVLIPHRSWKKPDQFRLVDYYLSKVPYASSRGYKALSAIMKVSSLIEVLKKHIPSNSSDRNLLGYYALPVLKDACKTAKDNMLFDELSELLQ